MSERKSSLFVLWKSLNTKKKGNALEKKWPKISLALFFPVFVFSLSFTGKLYLWLWFSILMWLGCPGAVPVILWPLLLPDCWVLLEISYRKLFGQIHSCFTNCAFLQLPHFFSGTFSSYSLVCCSWPKVWGCRKLQSIMIVKPICQWWDLNSLGEEETFSSVKKKSHFINLFHIHLGSYWFFPSYMHTYAGVPLKGSSWASRCPPLADSSSTTFARLLHVRQAPGCLYMLANTFACFFFLKPQAPLFDV